MIEIYDEMSHIKNILAHGFGNDTWKTDGKLLAMYYRDTGIKKSETLKNIKEKCERYCSGKDGSYNKTKSYKIVNNFVNKVYKKEKDGTYKEQIREIKEVKISKKIVEWFLDLEDNFILTDEQIEEFKIKRPKIKIKKNNPMNFERIKYLFTIYIWTLIKEQYLSKPNIIYLNDNNNKRRFKQRADLKTNFNLSDERNFLFDLGFIDVNHGLGIIPNFKVHDKTPEKIFEKPIDNYLEDDIIIIKDMDLYQCGYWLLKQKYGSFICEHCGKEFAHYSNKPNEKRRKYCKECAKDIDGKKIKKRFCIDCGKDIIPYMKKHGGRMIRCPSCQAIHLEFIKRKEERCSDSTQG